MHDLEANLITNKAPSDLHNRINKDAGVSNVLVFTLWAHYMGYFVGTFLLTMGLCSFYILELQNFDALDIYLIFAGKYAVRGTYNVSILALNVVKYLSVQCTFAANNPAF